eukprot:Hpha_TRINITY_DN15919_c0_g2::TRINITY_DN15919_c0_g2_i1::g.73446::m.73446
MPERGGDGNCTRQPTGVLWFLSFSEASYRCPHPLIFRQKKKKKSKKKERRKERRGPEGVFFFCDDSQGRKGRTGKMEVTICPPVEGSVPRLLSHVFFAPSLLPFVSNFLFAAPHSTPNYPKPPPPPKVSLRFRFAFKKNERAVRFLFLVESLACSLH